MTQSPDRLRETGWAELRYRRDGPGLWRFYDAETESAVGPIHSTRGALLRDLERFADVFGAARIAAPTTKNPSA